MATKSKLKNYQKLEKLGEGTYGCVYKARDKVNNRYVALKQVKLDPNEEGIPATTHREISLLKQLKHPTIVELYDQIYENDELYLVFEYMPYDLKAYLDSLGGKLPPKLLKRFMYQAIQSCYVCHSNRVLHRDLKPQNYLVDTATRTLKLCDFGLGREHGLPMTKLTHEVVTLWYRPPEILMGLDVYSAAVDVWALGAIFVEMATGKALFPGDSEIDQLYQIFKVLGTPNERTWPGVKKLRDFKSQFPVWRPKKMTEIIPELDAAAHDFLTQLLQYSPNQRITCKAALTHPYFAGADIR